MSCPCTERSERAADMTRPRFLSKEVVDDVRSCMHFHDRMGVLAYWPLQVRPKGALAYDIYDF